MTSRDYKVTIVCIHIDESLEAKKLTFERHFEKDDDYYDGGKNGLQKVLEYIDRVSHVHTVISVEIESFESAWQ